MRRLVPALAVGFALSACSDGSEAVLSGETRSLLVSDVAAVKEAASRQDRPASEEALAALHRDIAAAQARGELDTATARKMLTATDRVAADVRTLRYPAPEPPVTVTVPTPEQAPLESPEQNGEGEKAEKRREEAEKKAEEGENKGEKKREEAKKKAEEKQEEADEKGDG
ncbi:hypothetical protein [Parasphingorhabdus pacifica]